MTLLKKRQKRMGVERGKSAEVNQDDDNNNNTYEIFRSQKARREGRNSFSGWKTCDETWLQKNTRIRTNNKQNGISKPELAYEDEAYVMYMTSRRLSGAAMKRMLSISATKPRIVHATSSAGVCSDGLVLCRSAHTSEGQGSRRRRVVVVFALLPKSRQKEKFKNEKLENKAILEGFQSPELRKNS